jgi:hypothetical protein
MGYRLDQFKTVGNKLLGAAQKIGNGIQQGLKPVFKHLLRNHCFHLAI